MVTIFVSGKFIKALSLVPMKIVCTGSTSTLMG